MHHGIIHEIDTDRTTLATRNTSDP